MCPLNTGQKLRDFLGIGRESDKGKALAKPDSFFGGGLVIAD